MSRIYALLFVLFYFFALIQKVFLCAPFSPRYHILAFLSLPPLFLTPPKRLLLKLSVMNTPPTTTNEKEERSKRELKDPTSISDHNVKRQRTSHNATVEGILHYPYLFYFHSLSFSLFIFCCAFYFIFIFLLYFIIFGNLFYFILFHLRNIITILFFFTRHEYDRLCNSGYNHT